MIARVFVRTCTDPTAQTVEEIHLDLEARGVYSQRAKILRWIAGQIAQGTMERVKVLRKNARGVLRAVDAYRVIEK